MNAQSNLSPPRTDLADLERCRSNRPFAVPKKCWEAKQEHFPEDFFRKASDWSQYRHEKLGCFLLLGKPTAQILNGGWKAHFVDILPAHIKDLYHVLAIGKCQFVICQYVAVSSRAFWILFAKIKWVVAAMRLNFLIRRTMLNLALRLLTQAVLNRRQVVEHL